MQKEEFLKEVTRIFSTQNFDELNAFLKDNLELSLGNRRFIKTLNKDIGNESVDKTFIDLSNTKKAQSKASKADLINTFKNNDEKSFFEKLSKFDEEKKITIDNDLLHHYIKSDYQGDLYNKYLYKLLEEMPSYSQQHQDFLSYKFINHYSTHRSDIGEKYCAITKNQNDYLYLLKDKARINIFEDVNKALSEAVKNSVNVLFDELAKDGVQENSYFHTHFYHHPFEIALLSSDRQDKLIQTGLFDKDTITQNLINSYEKQYAKYFIENQKSPIDISFNTALNLIYAKVHQKVYKDIDLDKFNLNKDIAIDEKSLHSICLIFSYNENRGHHKQWKPENPENIKNALQLFDKFGLKDLQFTDAQFNHLIRNLTYDKIKTVVEESHVFKLSDTQKELVSNVLNDYNGYIANQLNERFSENYEVISNFVNSHLDDKDFISKLSQENKEKIIARYISFYDLKDEKSFINNFASTLEVKPYSEYSNLLGDVNFKGKDEILSYILNEKINYDVVDLFGISASFHLLTADNKEKVIKASYNEKNIPLNNFHENENQYLYNPYSIYSNRRFEDTDIEKIIMNQCSDEKVKENLREIAKLYNSLKPTEKKSPKM
jgi:hypothetical protein